MESELRMTLMQLSEIRLELAAVTEQRDKALQKIKNQAERIAYLEGATNHATGTPLSKAIEQRDKLTAGLEVAQQVGIQLGEQRDRLAEALNKLTQYDLGDIPIGIVRECNEALQSAQSPLVRGCSHDPRTLAGMPIGQYHCPECGEMVIAGLAHDPEPPTKQNG